jgi:hypothetical protein
MSDVADIRQISSIEYNKAMSHVPERRMALCLSADESLEGLFATMYVYCLRVQLASMHWLPGLLH